ncbi:hypothetical protein QR98_0064890 [Sarcoptes scabiei]|nr:hypothetical protein QR98_0064890 [Sarcoptes scabiei]
MKSSKERFDRYDHIRREQTLSRKRFKHQPNRNRKSKTGKKLRSPSPMEIGAAVRKQSSSKNVLQQPEESLGRKSLNEIDSAPTALIAPDDYLHIYKREKN